MPYPPPTALDWLYIESIPEDEDAHIATISMPPFTNAKSGKVE